MFARNVEVLLIFSGSCISLTSRTTAVFVASDQWLATIIYLYTVLSCLLLRAVTISCRPTGQRQTNYGNQPKLINVFEFSAHVIVYYYAWAMAIYRYKFYVAGLLLFVFFDTNCRQVICSRSNNFLPSITSYSIFTIFPIKLRRTHKYCQK